MSARGTERSRLRLFFEFDDIIDPPVWLGPLTLLQLGIVGYGAWKVATTDREGRPDVLGYGFLEGALMAGGLLISTALIIYAAKILHKMLVRFGKQRRLRRLERDAAATLKADYKRALKALLKASELKPKDLQQAEMSIVPRFEALMFGAGELDVFLGPVREQSLRAVVPQGKSAQFGPLAGERLDGEKFFEGYFAPFRVSCVFFSKDKLVIGEAVCDPATGELQKRVRHLPRAEIKSQKFEWSLREVPVPEEIVSAWLENRRYDPREQSRISAILDQHDRLKKTASREGNRLPDLPFAYRQVRTHLMIELSSGETVRIPVKHDQLIVSRATILDADATTGFSTDRLDDLDELPVYASESKIRARSPLWTDPDEIILSRQGAALWSSGRQALYREYSGFWPFARTALAGLVVGLGAIAAMNAAVNDWTERYSSTEEDALLVETPSGDQPLVPEDARLANELKGALEDSAYYFACSRRSVPLRSIPTARSTALGQISAKRPMIVDNSTENAPPEGWQRVVVLMSGDQVTGYVQTGDIEIYPPRARTVCPQ